jgi:hypothetical protein
MNLKDSLFFLAAAVVAVLLAHLIVYNVQEGQKLF